MRILLLGASSFAATGVAERLIALGHDVICFNRGRISAQASLVWGPLGELSTNPHLPGELDAVINYIVLKDRDADANVAFMRALATFCLSRSVKHLVHFSSISSYAQTSGEVVEDSPVEQKPERKGAYGSLKTATDLFLLREFPESIKLTLVRPGFILAPGLLSPIIGTAVRLPWNRLLLVGNGHASMPVTTRDLVHAAVASILEAPPPGNREVVMVVDPRSPSRYEYLQHCVRALGAGSGVMTVPRPFWWGAAICGELASRLLGQGRLHVYHKLSARLGAQRYNPAKSAARLGLDLATDWKGALRAAVGGQEPNFRIPASPPKVGSPPPHPINYIGCGRIVAQKHLPALRRMKFAGRLEGYDVSAISNLGEIRVRAISEFTPGNAGLQVVATPGPLHREAIGLLEGVPGAILVEKPLCDNSEDLEAWIRFAAARSQPVAVCHNYRFKSNVLAFFDLLREFNPGRLLHAFVDFSSPPVAADSAAWARDERGSKTLLMDYSIHFLDAACMFWAGPWCPRDITYATDARGNTQRIAGTLDSTGEGGYRVDFLIRQGFAPRRARVSYAFQNYMASLDFFPDTFSFTMSGDTAFVARKHAKAIAKATRRKIFDKLGGRDGDKSHDRVLYAMLTLAGGATSFVEVAALQNFYKAMFSVAERVYGG